MYWRWRKRLVVRLGRRDKPPVKPVIQGFAEGGEMDLEMDEDGIEELKRYILHRGDALDRDLLPYGDPAGKDVLVFGGSFGTEVLWAIRREARSILSIDLTRVSSAPLKRAMAEQGLQHPNFEFRTENIMETALRGDRFDLIVSNGVFEHVMDLRGVLTAYRDVLRPGGRIAIFADGLWYSSIGGHIRANPWEHLWRAPADIKERYPDRWRYYRDQLNRMTIVDFLEAVRSVGLLVLQLNVGRDRHLAELNGLLPEIRARHTGVSPTDMSIVSIGCELCFPEHY
jgi:SAM-dependent methyltransferase